ncbi:MAG: cysteine hydrolase family protein [Methylococcaceae bacterium]|jgi:nicotinamidase-related amidase
MPTPLRPDQTAILLIGYQNDYFADDGALHTLVESSAADVLDHTLEMLDRLKDSTVTMISTPIRFTKDYRELVNPIGILKIIKDRQAFRMDTAGGNTIAQLKAFGDRIIEIPGKRGLNAFSNTRLLSVLSEKGITNIILMGVVTSLCIESTGREAFEHGLHVIIVSDATAGRTRFEQDYYCSEIFPLYADVADHLSLIARLTAE